MHGAAASIRYADIIINYLRDGLSALVSRALAAQAVGGPDTQAGALLLSQLPDQHDGSSGGGSARSTSVSAPAASNWAGGVSAGDDDTCIVAGTLGVAYPVACRYGCSCCQHVRPYYASVRVVRTCWAF